MQQQHVDLQLPHEHLCRVELLRQLLDLLEQLGGGLVEQVALDDRLHCLGALCKAERLNALLNVLGFGP